MWMSEIMGIVNDKFKKKEVILFVQEKELTFYLASCTTLSTV